MNWDELYAQGIDVEDISRDSEEYQTMFSAAVHGNPTAQYCLGLWAEKVHKKPDVALTWLKKAAQQNFEEAIEALQRLVGEQGVVFESTTSEDGSSIKQTSLIIKEHNFQAAKNSLKKYTEKAKKDVEITRVPTKGGLFNLGSHVVEGKEFNDRMSQVQTYLINLNSLSQGLIDEFGEVYKAFESLDKDYISGIVASIKAAEEVSKQEQKDRKDIKELVAQHELSVAVLKKFKADIDQLKHLTDIDKAWELIENQVKLSKEFSEYLAELSKVNHLKDVDALYTNFEKLHQEFCELTEKHSQYAVELKTVQKYCDSLSKLKHIGDIDELWDIADAATQEIQNLKNALDEQKCAIADFCAVIQQAQEAQQQFVDKINLALSNYNEDFNKQFKAFTDAQTAKLDDIDRHYTDGIEKLSVEQKEKFEELLETQSLTLEKIANEQTSKLAQICQSLEDEKNALREQVNVLTQRVKLSYIIAGSAAALTVVQLLLNILGVF